MKKYNSNVKKKFRKMSEKAVRSLFTTIGLLLCLYILLILYLPPILYRYLNATQSILTSPAYANLLLGIFIILYVIANIGVFLLMAYAAKIHIREFWRSSALSLKRFLTDTLLLITIVYFSSSVSSVILNLFGIPSQFVAPIGIVHPEKYYELPLYLILFILITPLIEEFTYRGVMLRILGRFSNRFAVYTVALIYALAHTSPAEMVPAFLMSVFLSKMTLSNKSIFPSIIVHLLLNATLLPIAFIPENYAWLISIFMALLIVLSIIIILTHNNTHVILKKGQGKGIAVLFYKNIIIIISLVLLLVHSFFFLFIK